MAKVDLSALAVTLAIGALGGVVAALLEVPLGFLLGSLLAVGITAAMGWRPLGRGITMPVKLRMCFVPVIGVAIGGAFTPEVAREALGWGGSLLGLLVFVPMAHAVGYVLFRTGGLPRVDAYFSALPGGLIESVQLGEEAGADVRLLTVLQFLRLILTIIAVPLIFAGVTGHAVGSAAGVQMTGADAALGPRDVLILLACGGIGVWLARLCRIPAWIITGPLILSALVHVLGWVEGVPPGWLISVTQVVLGTGLGARFAGVSGAMLRRAGLLAVLNGAAVMTLAYGFAFVLHALVGESVAAVFLAFAPGGLAEMSLIALSLNISAIYVTTHHVLRIALAVLAAQIGVRWFLKR
ncbi:AbrB family transcriptional regulator [Pseudorhodobacter sp. MZDSW-24AT]|uniref:AbrB family transcriptional regulator n=1 Tax=Pseudorhodobacter sp. MZDSW-24AT TaxID=2052957 RepID=UPI000C1F2B45|nr:AbrB family transcriptional regulator [Pseudorhodobacter sp. MZDSW-24AT]PJF09758.1 aminopeptidase [Pseudorhodobacter sp. MZDSW-24AT]